MDESQLWRVLLWGLGICVTGFLFLAGWMWWIVGKLHDKVSFDWIEQKFEAGINRKMDAMSDTLTEIKNALVGDFQRKGLIAKFEDTEKSIKGIQEKCERFHPAA